MARRKRLSPVYDAAITRKAALASIDDKLDLGNDLTLTNYQTVIDDVKTALDQYNTMLSSVDIKLNELQAKEKLLQSMNERMLAGVAAKYSKDSNEYEQAGGTKKSETAARTKKPKGGGTTPTP
jgi:hypothetical protein